MTQPNQNHLIYIFQKTDGVQKQMLQIKSNAFGDDEDAIKKAKKVGVQLAQDLASKKIETKDELKTRRDEMLPSSKRQRTSQAASSNQGGSGSAAPTASFQPASVQPASANVRLKKKTPKSSTYVPRCGFCNEPADKDSFALTRLCLRCNRGEDSNACKTVGLQHG